MTYVPVTPFRRAISAADLKHQAVAQAPLPDHPVNKWEALRELAAARTVFGLSDRDMTVLQALVSFHPGTDLTGGTVVHPSNKAICERLSGMPCSTMRRHLAALVRAGVVLRRDSPNGKRYARRMGGDKLAFGFDLTPLVARFAEICDAAEALRAEAERLSRLRETVSLMRRDLAGLAAFGATQRPDLLIWDAFSDLARLMARDLRRQLSLSDLETLEFRLHEALEEARDILEPRESKEMSTNGDHSERHIQNSKTDSQDSEPRLEKAMVAEVEHDPDASPLESGEAPPVPALPLAMILAVCLEVQTYAEGPIRHWHEFVRVVDRVRPMMGISPSAWEEARHHMGPEEAAIVVAAMLERFTEIKNPGGYLRSLSDKAASGAFSSGPMIMALMRKAA